MSRKKLFILIGMIISLNFFLLQHAMATSNIIVNFPVDWSLTPEEGKVLITYADVDEDPTTGAYDGFGNWQPNETQIVLYPINGKITVNAGIDGGIFFDGPGDFALRFIDTTAPGWVWNNPDTWVPRKITRAQLEMSRDGHSWDPTPCIKAQAYEFWTANLKSYPQFIISPHLVASAVMTNESHGIGWHAFTLLSCFSGFSEIYVHSDYTESAIRNLCLFDSPLFSRYPSWGF